jgi:hypothetical protein
MEKEQATKFMHDLLRLMRTCLLPLIARQQ